MTTMTTLLSNLDALSAHLDYLQLPAIRKHYTAFARRASESGQTHIAFLASLVDEEVRGRRERAAKQRLAASKMPCVKTMDSWDWKWNAATIHREQIVPLFELDFLREKANVLLVGKQGLGKSHIALALGHALCSAGVRTLFTTAAAMVNRLMAATADRSLEKALLLYTRPSVLILDEVGYLPFSKEAGDLVFQVITTRYERGSIILTSNRGFKHWNQIFADNAVAAVIIERLVHHARIVPLRGKSYRLKDKLEIDSEAKIED